MHISVWVPPSWTNSQICVLFKWCQCVEYIPVYLQAMFSASRIPPPFFWPQKLPVLPEPEPVNRNIPGFHHRSLKHWRTLSIFHPTCTPCWKATVWKGTCLIKIPVSRGVTFSHGGMWCIIPNWSFVRWRQSCLISTMHQRPLWRANALVNRAAVLFE